MSDPLSSPGRVARIALGSSYGGHTGAELGRLVAYLAPWMVASIALSVAFPLLFVRGRAAWLPLLAAAALGLHVLVEWAARAWLGLATGISRTVQRGQHPLVAAAVAAVSDGDGNL